MSSYEYETTRRARLIGYLIRDQFNQEPTAENIENVMNSENIEQIIKTLDGLLNASQHLQIHNETLESMK